MKISNDTSGNRTRELPAYSAVPYSPKEAPYQFNRRVSGPESRSGPSLRGKNILPLAALEPTIAEPTA